MGLGYRLEWTIQIKRVKEGALCWELAPRWPSPWIVSLLVCVHHSLSPDFHCWSHNCSSDNNTLPPSVPISTSFQQDPKHKKISQGVKDRSKVTEWIRCVFRNEWEMRKKIEVSFKFNLCNWHGLNFWSTLEMIELFIISRNTISTIFEVELLF